MRKKVYVPNKGGHRFDDAERFGKLIFITEGSQDRFAVTNLYRTFVKAFSESSEDDYFLISSMNTLNAIGAAIFARKHGCLNLLLFRKGKYEERRLDIDSLLDDDLFVDE